jgi:hypothetical protein
MARGIVTVINADGMSGQVQQDETNDVFNYSGQNLAALGLTTTAPTNTCSFDIDEEVLHQGTAEMIIYSAINIAVAPPLNFVPPITGPSGSITAGPNDVYTITGTGAVVTGNVVINGGRVIVDAGAQVNGPVNVTADGIIVARGNGTQVTGNVTINSGGSLKVVKTAVVTGTIGINGGGRMIAGDTTGPGTITGLVDIAGIRKVDISAGSVING